MIKKIFIAMVAIATLSFVSCKKNEIKPRETETPKIGTIQEEITTSNNENPINGSTLKSTSNTTNYKFTSCVAFIYVNIPVNSDKTIKIEIYENTGIGGGLNIDSWPRLNISAITSLPNLGYKITWTVPRSSLGSDSQFRVTIRPNGCGYAIGKIVVLTY